MQYNLLYINRLKIGTLLAADRMRRPAERAGQVSRITMQIISCTQRKGTRTDYLHQQDVSIRLKCPYTTHVCIFDGHHACISGPRAIKASFTSPTRSVAQRMGRKRSNPPWIR
jgi:hypothetical protein